MTTGENIQRDGNMLVVPFENPVFPKRCVKTNLDVKECDFSVVIESSTTKLAQSDAGSAASVIGGQGVEHHLPPGSLRGAMRQPLHQRVMHGRQRIHLKNLYSYACQPA